MKKKSYNPFKLWGSWVGAVIFMLFFSVYYNSPVANYIENISLTILGISAREQAIFFTIIVVYGLYFIMGFLPGWGIHSLIRRLEL